MLFPRAPAMLVTTSHAVWRAEIPNNKAGSVTDSVMRKAVLIAAGLFVIGCGPDPNAQLPGVASPAKAGGTTGNGGAGGTTHGSGGIVGSGGKTTSQGGTGGLNPFAGGTTGSTGGIVSSGGKVGSGGLFGTGGVASSGGVASTGGVVDSTGGIVGAGGTSLGSGGSAGAEPCSSPIDFSGTSSFTFNSTSEVCMRTQDDITGTNWNCSNFTGWTLKVNSVTTTCGSALPPKLNGYFYFDATPGTGALAWAAIYWYNATLHPGPYPPWPGGTTGSTDASAVGPVDAAEGG